MKSKKYITHICVLLFALIAVFLVGCKNNGESGDAGTGEGNEKVAISLDVKEIMLGVGDTFSLTAKVTSKDLVYKVIWDSADPSVATVNQNGLVTAVGIGETRCSAQYGTEIVTCTVTVSSSAKNSLNAQIKNSFNLNVSDVLDLKNYLTVRYGKSEVSEYQVTCVSDDDTIVSAEGSLIKAHKAGSVNVVLTVKVSVNDIEVHGTKLITVTVY